MYFLFISNKKKYTYLKTKHRLIKNKRIGRYDYSNKWKNKGTTKAITNLSFEISFCFFYSTIGYAWQLPAHI